MVRRKYFRDTRVSLGVFVRSAPHAAKRPKRGNITTEMADSAKI
jgi:hypothetical protein